MSRILVIKHGAFGDVVQALGPMKAIRRHHPEAHITLLTTSPFAAFCRATGWFDAIDIDSRPPFWRIDRILALRKTLQEGAYEWVYDLQTSRRTSMYFRLLHPKPKWSGIASGCSHPHANPKRKAMHTLERQAEQLAMAGIDNVAAPDLSWLTGDLSAFDLPENPVLLAPGCAPHRPEKRWPAARYGALASRLVKEGLTPLILGTAAEIDVEVEILRACPEAVSLVGRTSLTDLGGLAKKARLAIGNDSGPMHLIAAAGCPSLVLFSKASDPARCGQRGRKVRHLRVEALASLTADEVMREIEASGLAGSTS